MNSSDFFCTLTARGPLRDLAISKKKTQVHVTVFINLNLTLNKIVIMK